MSDEIPDDAVGAEYFVDTVNSYMEEGDDEITAMEKAAKDALELINDE